MRYRIIREVRKRTSNPGRWNVWLYLDHEINWEKLKKNSGKLVEYDPEIGIRTPIIRTMAGTIRYLKKCIILMSPYEDLIKPLKKFALNRLNPKKRAFWEKEILELDTIEKRLFGRRK